MASSEPVIRQLQVTLLGNPVVCSEVVVEVRGAEGSSLRLQLMDLQGRLVSERWLEQAEAVETQRLPMGEPGSSVLVLRANTPGEMRSVQVIRVR